MGSHFVNALFFPYTSSREMRGAVSTRMCFPRQCLGKHTWVAEVFALSKIVELYDAEFVPGNFGKLYRPMLTNAGLYLGNPNLTLQLNSI